MIDDAVAVVSQIMEQQKKKKKKKKGHAPGLVGIWLTGQHKTKT